MFKFLELTFSTEGCIGRPVWWWTQLVCVSAFVVLTVCLALVSVRVSHLSSYQWVAHDTYFQSLPAAERNREKRDMQEVNWNIIDVLVILLFIVLWAHLVIEVKRWHDLEMSGYCVWYRILPIAATMYFGPFGFAITSLAVWFGSIYYLGIRPGLHDHFANFEQPARSRWAILNDVAGPVCLIVFVVALCKFGFIQPPTSVTTTSEGLIQSITDGSGRNY
jgi:uncharacterized membrane protein YhaH (DUF805 family)